MPPPDIQKITKQLEKSDLNLLLELYTRSFRGESALDSYLPWDKLRYKTPPDGLNHEHWWLTVRLARNGIQRALPLRDREGRKFTYALPDEVLRAFEEINRDASGNIGISEQVTNPSTRNRYLVNSLIEEAITSSQLEGASTERSVAKEMIRSGRAPNTRDELMILNNYKAMRRIGDLRNEELTPDLICEIHRIVTEGTLENDSASGRFQLPSEDRVGVYDQLGNLLHTPPPAEELPVRVKVLCDFANGETEESYLPSVLRAITLHFTLSYDHPFEDGNGRTARALFYWSMLRQGYWLAEFLTVSKILRKAPSKYARSFLYTEQDQGDLTYFHIYHLDVIRRSIAQLHEYLATKMEEVRDLQSTLSMLPGEFNYRQLALLKKAVTSPGQEYTTSSHALSHSVTIETARQDLRSLEKRKLLKRVRRGKAYAWLPVSNLSTRLRPQ